MLERAKTVLLAVVLGVPLIFHLLFQQGGQYAYRCRRSLLGWFLVEQGGIFATLVRSTEHLFMMIVVGLLLLALLVDVHDRLR